MVYLFDERQHRVVVKELNIVTQKVPADPPEQAGKALAAPASPSPPNGNLHIDTAA